MNHTNELLTHRRQEKTINKEKKFSKLKHFFICEKAKPTTLWVQETYSILDDKILWHLTNIFSTRNIFWCKAFQLMTIPYIQVLDYQAIHLLSFPINGPMTKNSTLKSMFTFILFYEGNVPRRIINPLTKPPKTKKSEETNVSKELLHITLVSFWSSKFLEQHCLKQTINY